MSHKRMLFRSEAREKLLRGVSALADAVRVTLGPKSKCTGDAVGDGTSTATLLAHAIFADGVRNVVAGASAVDLKRGLDRGSRVVIESLKALSRPVKSRLEKAQVAAISAHNDASIGELIADAMEKVGDDGVITRRRPRRPRRSWRSWAGCSSTAATSRRTS